jgi:hypothetical protein
MTAELSVPTQADISADTEMFENRRNRHSVTHHYSHV